MKETEKQTRIIDGQIKKLTEDISKTMFENLKSINESWGNPYPKEVHKESCYFYNSVKDMGGNIPTCDYYGKLGYCPCNECVKFVDKSEVFDIVKKIADKK
jgi:hypothetical protein